MKKTPSARSTDPVAEAIEEQDTWSDLSSSIAREALSADISQKSKVKHSSPSKRPLRRSPRRTSKGPRGRVNGLRLLIVDDDPTQLDQIAAELSKLGAKVAVGDRGESGYNQATQIVPDAVISDLVSPGEKAWTLVRQLRRHPILRWTPILLFRWWEETAEGKKQVLLDRVIDRLEEILAPNRVLKERISAGGRPLNEQIEMTGPHALLRLLSSESLSGLLTVNDAFSMFELDLKRGKPYSLTRRGLDGVTDEGEDAFMQLLLCDSAKWTFKSDNNTQSRANIMPDMEKALSQSGQMITALFGAQKESDHRASSHLDIRMEALGTQDTGMSPLEVKIIESISAGLPDTSLDSLFEDRDSVFIVESTLQTLVRRGAIKPRVAAINKDRGEAEQKAAQSVAYLLEMVAYEHANITELSVDDICAENTLDMTDQDGSTPNDSANMSGTYSVSEVKPERVGSKIRATIRVPGSPTDPDQKDLPPNTDEATPITPIDSTPVTDDKPEPSKNRPAPSHQVFGMGRGLIRDSLAPSPNPIRDGGAGKKQMWAAIFLALLLIGMVAAGLAFISSGGR